MKKLPHAIKRQGLRSFGPFAASLLATFLAACVTGNRDVNLNAVQSWHGAKESELIEVWGRPTSLDEYEDGYKVLHYSDYTPPQSKGPPAFILLDAILPESLRRPIHSRKTPPVSCTAQFVIAPEGHVKRSAWYGDHCAPRPRREG